MKIIKPANILYLDITGIHSCNIKNQIKLTVSPCMLRNLHFFHTKVKGQGQSTRV